MELAFFVDPLPSFNLKKDSTMAMMVEAASRGHTVYSFCYQDIVLLDGLVCAQCCRLALSGGFSPDWYRPVDTVLRPLSEFEAVIIRKDPPFEVNYLTSVWMLSLAAKQGAKIFNDADAILTHSEKLSIAQFSQFTKPTLVSADEQSLRQFHAEHRDIILKPLGGLGGMGIFHVREDGLNLGAIIEMLTGNGQRHIMAQAYIPEISDGDKRVLLINGKVVPFALARIPKLGETRGNLAVGGTGRAQPLMPRDREIAEALAPKLNAKGLFLVGLDIIGDWLTEINVTSPTCFREITEQTGFNVAGMLVDELEKVLEPVGQ